MFRKVIIAMTFRLPMRNRIGFRTLARSSISPMPWRWASSKRKPGFRILSGMMEPQPAICRSNRSGIGTEWNVLV